METKKKICFVICPIGKPNSETRKRSDSVLKNIIRPVLKKEYEIIRSDKISRIGNITSQIINYLMASDLVIADLSSLNPNVFYELAIRHTTGKPYIQLIQTGEKLPFDIVNIRTIEFSPHDIDSLKTTKQQLKEVVNAINFREIADSPISHHHVDIVNILHKFMPENQVYKGHKFIMFRSREKMIQYFDVMLDKAKEGDDFWAQGVGHTSYSPNFIERIGELIEKRVSFKFIINGSSLHAQDFLQELDKVPKLERKVAPKNTLRLFGLSDKEVIISLPHSSPPYEALVIKDKAVVTILREWFYKRFKKLHKTTL